MQNLLNDLIELSSQKIRLFQQPYRRFLYERIAAGSSKCIGIYGSRGVGKTTLMLQLAASMPYQSDEILYVSCDHPLLSDVSLSEVVQFFYKYGGKAVFVDEIHEAPNFEKELKSIHDFIDIKVVFSGSSAVKITNPSFTRRFGMFHLPVLSFREYLELSLNIELPNFTLEDIWQNHSDFAAEILKKMGEEKILRHFRDYLDHGAYPFYFAAPDTFTQMLLDTVNAILYKDLVPIYNIAGDKVLMLKKLLVSLCLSEPMELNIERLARKIGIAKATLYKYIEYLHRAELLTHIMHEGKRFKALQKPDKLYLANGNLFKVLCLEPKIGTVRESFFVSMMMGAERSIHYVERGDFLVDEKYTVEIGGKQKDFSQIRNLPDSYLLSDGIETGFKNRIPLWLFGFLY